MTDGSEPGAERRPEHRSGPSAADGETAVPAAVADGGPVADDVVGPEDTWRRVHVISPLVRGWIALVALLFIFGRGWFESFFGSGGGSGGPLPEGVGVLLAGGILLGVVLLIAVVFLVSWYFTRYQVTSEHVRVHSGVVFRQQRQARLDRVQAIDIIQPFLARIFGLAELKFEVADAGESAVRLAFLRIDDARRLRATLLARAAGVAEDPEHPDEVLEAPEREVVSLSPGRVVGSVVLSGTSIALVVSAASVVGFSIWFDTPVVFTSFIPILIGLVGAYWSALNTGYNFRAATSPDGLRMRYGLLDTRSQTVPPGRVQALGIVQSPLWRLKGWYRVTVNVAGYGASASTEGQARATLLPVGTRDEVLQILALVLPDPGTSRPVEIFSAGMDGRGDAEGFTTTPRRARWLAPLAWRRNGFAVTGTAVLVRSGVLWRSLAVVPHERTQSVSLHQGPVDRRFRVAGLQFQTTPGPVSPTVPLMDTVVAWDLFHGQAARAAEARRRSGPEQWMMPVPEASSAAGASPDAGAAPVRPDGLDGPATTDPVPPATTTTTTTPTPLGPGSQDREQDPVDAPHPGENEVMPEIPSYTPADQEPPLQPAAPPTTGLPTPGSPTPENPLTGTPTTEELPDDRR